VAGGSLGGGIAFTYYLSGTLLSSLASFDGEADGVRCSDSQKKFRKSEESECQKKQKNQF
jgi:hypothetical protein